MAKKWDFICVLGPSMDFWQKRKTHFWSFGRRYNHWLHLTEMKAHKPVALYLAVKCFSRLAHNGTQIVTFAVLRFLAVAHNLLFYRAKTLSNREVRDTCPPGRDAGTGVAGGAREIAKFKSFSWRVFLKSLSPSFLYTDLPYGHDVAENTEKGRFLRDFFR